MQAEDLKVGNWYVYRGSYANGRNSGDDDYKYVPQEQWKMFKCVYLDELVVKFIYIRPDGTHTSDYTFDVPWVLANFYKPQLTYMHLMYSKRIIHPNAYFRIK